MLFSRSSVAICTFFIVIFNPPFNNSVNCESTISYSRNLLWTQSPQEDVNLNDNQLSPVSSTVRVKSTELPTNFLISTEQDELRSTEKPKFSSSSIPSSEIDYFPNINVGWCLDCCEDDEIFVKSEQKCLKRSFIADECISSEQCIVPQSTCLRNMCVCIDYFVDFSRNKCTPIHNTAIEIYKITMIFASSCLALILLIFLACILRKSYCPADSTHQGTSRSTINDLFTIYPGTSGSPNELFNSLTPVEKPPSYSETMRMINQEIGTPPPAYHNIFYTETSSTNQQNSNIINSNEQSSSSSQPSQSANSNNGLTPATSSTQSTINAQNHNLYSSLSQPPPTIVGPPSSPPLTDVNQGKVNSAFDCDS